MVNIVTKINGDTLSAAEFNQLPDELENLVTDSTQTPSAAILDQISKGVSNYSTVGTYFIDSGAANAYVLSPVSPFKAPTSYFDGMLVRFRAGNNNTGASTLNLNALGVKSIKLADGTTDVDADDITDATDMYLRFDSGNDAFIVDTPSSISGILVGDYKYSAIAADHPGWLLCDDTAVSRVTFSELFTLIGTAFGIGDGATTFNLPDLRSSAPGGVGQRPSQSNRAIADFVGSETQTLSVANLPSHDHAFGNGGNTFGVANGGSGLEVSTAGTNARTGNTGSGTGHNNMQPTLFAGSYFIFSGVI